METLEMNSSLREQTVLNEKYRPTKLEDYVGNVSLKAMLKKQIAENDIHNMLFYSPAGCGKTTLAKLIVHNLDCESLVINASDERGIETIRGKISGFASGASFKPLKVVILDEADFLTIQAQASLRNVIESFSRTTRFILTCNYVERIIDPIQSRCQVFNIIPPDKVEVAVKLKDICIDEEIKYDLNDIKDIVIKFYPDMRKMINTIQSSTIDGELKLDKSIFISSNYMGLIVEELKTPKPSFRKIRQIIADSNVTDFDNLYKFLFDSAEEYLPGKQGTVAIYVNEHLYQSGFRIDKEINISSLIQKLINEKK